MRRKIKKKIYKEMVFFNLTNFFKTMETNLVIYITIKLYIFKIVIISMIQGNTEKNFFLFVYPK